MNPNEINKLKEKAPFPLLMLLILFFLPAFLLEPEAADLSINSKSLDTSLKKARESVVTREDLQHKNSRMQQLEKIKADMQADMPEEAALPEFINSLQSLAAANSVVLEDVSYAMQKQYAKLAVPGYQIVMNLSASYPDVRSYLAAVENLSTPVIINEIVLTESNRYVLTMRLLVK